MKIGIFGGAFNPPHNMHKKIAVLLINKRYVDKVIYVPTGNKYQKKDLIDAKDRFNMLKLMIRDNKNLEVSDFEIKNKLTYTYQTLDYFKSIYPNDEIYFICGADNLNDFINWRNYQYIMKNYKILVIKRAGEKVDDLLIRYKDFINNIIITEIDECGLSSTLLRNNLKNNEQTLDYLDDEVLNYIKTRKLYIGGN